MSSGVTSLREEFALKCFALKFHKQEAFCEAQWRWPRPIFLVYRLIMSGYAIFAFFHMVAVLSSVNDPHNLMAYLTNWTYLVEMLFFTLGAVLAVCFFLWPRHFRDSSHTAECDPENQSKVGIDNPAYIGKTSAKNYGSSGSSNVNAQSGRSAAGANQVGSSPWYIQLYWLLSNVVQVFCLTVSIVYFTALYSASEGITFLDLNLHGLNSVMIFIDVFVCARPVRLLHVVYPVLYGILYVIFSVIYWSQDHEQNVLYPNVLDWNFPGTTCAVVAGLALVGIPLLQLLNYGVYRLRQWVYEKIYGEKYM